jgi:hypothetical protein
VGGSLPDPLAKLIVGGKELIVTPVESNTLSPTWPNQTRANYRIALDASVVVEVWDSNAISDHPICTKKITDIHEDAIGGVLEINCNSGASVTLNVRPADPVIGLGFDYEVQGEGLVRVTRVVPESPASRAGLKAGAMITSIQGKPVKSLDALQVQSLVNSNSRSGLVLDYTLDGGSPKHVKVREGAIYLLSEEKPAG